MIDSIQNIFTDSLLQYALWITLVTGFLAPLAGCFLLLRRATFLGVALPQVSAAGMALGATICGAIGIGFGSGEFCAHCAGLSQVKANADAGWFMTSGGVYVQMTIALLITFAALAWLSRLEHREMRGRGTGSDARYGALYALSGAAAILLLAASPQSENNYTSMLRGEIVAVGEGDFWLVLAILTPATLALALFRHEFLWSSADPRFTAAAGRGVLFWNSLLLALIGTVICATIYIAGPLVCMGAMLLPALSAHILARNMRVFLLLAPVLGLLGAFIGVIVAFENDLPTGMTIIATHGVVLLLAKLTTLAARLLVARVSKPA